MQNRSSVYQLAAYSAFSRFISSASFVGLVRVFDKESLGLFSLLIGIYEQLFSLLKFGSDSFTQSLIKKNSESKIYLEQSIEITFFIQAALITAACIIIFANFGLITAYFNLPQDTSGTMVYIVSLGVAFKFYLQSLSQVHTAIGEYGEKGLLDLKFSLSFYTTALATAILFEHPETSLQCALLMSLAILIYNNKTVDTSWTFYPEIPPHLYFSLRNGFAFYVSNLQKTIPMLFGLSYIATNTDDFSAFADYRIYQFICGILLFFPSALNGVWLNMAFDNRPLPNWIKILVPFIGIVFILWSDYVNQFVFFLLGTDPVAGIDVTRMAAGYVIVIITSNFITNKLLAEGKSEWVFCFGTLFMISYFGAFFTISYSPIMNHILSEFLGLCVPLAVFGICRGFRDSLTSLIAIGACILALYVGLGSISHV